VRIGVHGSTGRMGRLVVEEVGRHDDLSLAWTATRDLPVNIDADVIIDFSVPDGLSRLLSVARCPVVSGTTGLVPPAHPPVALLHAANFSLGVAVLARLLREARGALPGWDLELVELHHNQKRDAPSGTALRLVEGLGPTTTGRDGPRLAGEVGLHAVRGGDIVGEHHAYLCGPGERLQLGHVATHRGLFAAGAVRCARWLRGKPPGLYAIDSVIAGGSG